MSLGLKVPVTQGLLVKKPKDEAVRQTRTLQPILNPERRSRCKKTGAQNLIADSGRHY